VHPDHPSTAAIADTVIMQGDMQGGIGAAEIPWGEDLEPLLRDLLTTSQSSIVKSHSQFALASILIGRGNEAANREAEELLEDFLRNSKEHRAAGNGPPSSVISNLPWEARENLALLRSGRPGMPAPRTAGLDLEGQPLNLAECRGRVTLVVFWATWCNPCMAMVPHELSLAKRYASRPFTLFGINGDKDPAVARRAADELHMTWRSLQSAHHPDDPDKTPNRYGLIWKAECWPTVILLDPQGIVKQRWRGAPDSQELDDAIEALVRQAEQAAPPAPQQ
jgi:thiol-disulfide isomerase/thioredoxin